MVLTRRRKRGGVHLAIRPGSETLGWIKGEVGRVFWRVFATNFEALQVDVVEPLLMVAGVLAAAIVVAAVPALLAARSHPAQLLRAE